MVQYEDVQVYMWYGMCILYVYMWYISSGVMRVYEDKKGI